MNILDAAQMKALFPTVSPQKRELYLPFLNLAMARFGINTERRVAMFCAQIAHESNNLSRWVENLNYSARRLTQVFPRRFPTVAAAAPFVGDNRKLANKIYGGRMGNRAGTDDGFNYRGRCPMQATGREMYKFLTKTFGAEFGVDFVANPDLLLKPEFGFMASAAIFAVEKGCNPLADAGQIVAVTRRINGGTNGLADRKINYERALRILPDGFRLLSYDAMKTQFALRQTETPQMENSTFDFENDYDAVKDEPAINSETEFQKTSDEAITQVSDAPDDLPDNLSGGAGGDTVQTADVIANVGTDEKKAEVDAAAALPTTEIERTPKTSFGGKLVGFFTALFTGQYIVPQFLADGFSANTSSIFSLIGAFLHGIYENRFLVFAGIVIWILVKKVNNYLLTKKLAEINTDPTRGNVVLVPPKDKETRGFFPRIYDKLFGRE